MGIVSLVMPDDIDHDLRTLAANIHGKDTRGKLSLTGTNACLLYIYIYQRLMAKDIPAEVIEDLIYKSIDRCIDEYFSTPLGED